MSSPCAGPPQSGSPKQSCSSPSSPKRCATPASQNSSSLGSDEGSPQTLKIKTVIHCLLEACTSTETEVRQAAAHSLSLVGKQYPLVVLQEWYSEYTKGRQSPRATPATRRRSVIPQQQQQPPPASRLTMALQPVIAVLVKHHCLDSGDVNHRAILGQIMAVVVEEMLQASLKEVHFDSILVDLSKDYMDKVMDVLLVHYQPNCSGSPINPVVVETLASLAYRHPHHCVPFLKAILSTTSHIMKSTKHGDAALKTEICRAICRFSEAILDYVSNVEEMPDTSVTIGHFQSEGDAIYDILYTSWLHTTKENKVKMLILECIAACTPFLSRENILDKGTAMLTSLISLYKKLGSIASLEVTLCISHLIEAITSVTPSGLDSVLDQVLNALFFQVCIPLDYLKSSIVKNHHEAIRSFDILMKFYPEKVVTGLLQKFEINEERPRVGALTVMKHLLNLPTKTLNYRLEEISNAIHTNLGEQNSNVRRLMAQTILVLGHHGTISGESGKDYIDFIVKLCAENDRNSNNNNNNTGSAAEPMAVMGDSILQLLTNTVSGVETVLWPFLLEYINQEEFTFAVSAVTKSLAVISKKKQINEEADFMVDFSQLQFCSNPVTLFARLLVLASNPQIDKRGTHILNFLKSFAANIHPGLKELWDSRFPLLLHYLEQHESVEQLQWHNWLLDLLGDSLAKIDGEEWSRRMAVSLVEQFTMYDHTSAEKSFAIHAVGYVLDKVKNEKVVMDNLSSLFLAALEATGPVVEESCAKAFGITARKHLKLLMHKLEMLYRSQCGKNKRTSFFGLFQKAGADETEQKSLTIILYSIGYAAKHAPTDELEKVADKMVQEFLLPSIVGCKSSERIQEAVLAAVSDVSIALHKILSRNDQFVMPDQEEVLTSLVNLLQDNHIPLTSKQMALISMTNLIQLPPAISQLTRCSMLKASFNTLFHSFLEADCFKHEDYVVARELELKLTSIADSLHILIKELLKQDMEQSTVDEIFTMLETWLRLDQALSRELSVSILQGALEVYSKNVKIGVGSPSNFTPGPYMIGAMVARCHDPSMAVRATALGCLQYLLRILGVYEGLSPETVEASVEQLNTLNTKCNSIEMAGKLDQPAISEALVNVLNDRVQHHHVLTLLDSLGDGLLDSQVACVAGCIAVFEGIVAVRGSEVFQNIPGLASKLHFKMTMMSIDETSELMTRVAVNIRHLCVHNCRGVITSLLRTELPFDGAARLVWSALSDDVKLSKQVLDILMEYSQEKTVHRSANGLISADPMAMASISALTIMLETHKLEMLCREEFGGLFGHLTIVAARFVSAKFDRKKSDTGRLVTLSPHIISLEAFRAVFSAINCLVVAHGITADQTVADVRALRIVLSKVVKAVVLHAPHLLQLIVSALLPLSNSPTPSGDSERELSMALLCTVALEKAGGDMVLLSSVVSSLLKGISDPNPTIREIVLEGLVAIKYCTVADIETLAEATINAFIMGVEDENSTDVALTALKGLSSILATLPAYYVHNAIDLISLKVRPYFEMSGNEHRAASISLYGRLARFAEGTFRTVYLDHCQSVLGPVLLYSTSQHQATSEACLKTLEQIVLAAEEGTLAEEIAKFNITKGFESLMDKIVDSTSSVIDAMLHSLVGQCLGYYRSSNPCLRRNAVILLSKVLCKASVKGDTGKGSEEELFAGVLGGTLDLLKDPDISVRKTAALYVGELITIQASIQQ